MSGPVDRSLARVLLATRWVDRAHRAFDRARSRAVLRMAGTGVLREFNSLAYQSDETYVPDADRFRKHLFAWETSTLRAYFPAPPARLLVGGAGGGREVFALAGQGYSVVAFEPAPELAAGMAVRAAGTAVHAFCSSYEQLPHLGPARPGDPAADLRHLAPFDGAVLGWGSFSHLLDHESRVRALRLLADVVDGPLLASFLAFGNDLPSGRGRRGRRGDAFSVYIGYYHVSTPGELSLLAEQAGLEIISLDTDQSESSWPHAVLARRGRRGVAQVDPAALDSARDVLAGEVPEGQRGEQR